MNILGENHKVAKVLVITTKNRQDLIRGETNIQNVHSNNSDNHPYQVPIRSGLTNFRIVEYEDSRQGHPGFEIVLNNSGSVLRYENYPFMRDTNPIVVIDSSS